MAVIIYHGSNVVVEHPRIQTVGYNKDFGFAFYCTRIERQAQRRALSKRPKHEVSLFSYEEKDDLNKLVFYSMTEQWLDFVVSCRMSITHRYDIVEGPMADDQIWNYVEDLVSGNISREAFWALVKFKHPTHQIAFCTEASLRTITFERSYEL